MTKQVLGVNVDAQSLGAAIELENRTQILATQTGDFREALTAFVEKRAPRYGGG
jgi:enoyl-CoA hydratase